jgi:iron complex outermembrane receptor protein
MRSCTCLSAPGQHRDGGYTLLASGLGASQDQQLQADARPSVKSRSKGVFDWEVAASLFDYQRPAAHVDHRIVQSLNGGAGT